MGIPTAIRSPGGVTAAMTHHGSVPGCSVPATTRNMPPRLQPSRFYRACLWLFLRPRSDAFFPSYFFLCFRVFTVHSFKMALRWHSGSARCFVQTTSGRFFLHSCIHETTLPHLFIRLEHETQGTLLKRSGAKLACGRPCGAKQWGIWAGVGLRRPCGAKQWHRNGRLACTGRFNGPEKACANK